EQRARQLLCRRAHGGARGQSEADVYTRGERATGASGLSGRSSQHVQWIARAFENDVTRPARPPRLATWLLGLVLPSTERAHVLGDLFEEYALRAQTETAPAVVLWYWGQVCRSL